MYPERPSVLLRRENGLDEFGSPLPAGAPAELTESSCTPLAQRKLRVRVGHDGLHQPNCARRFDVATPVLRRSCACGRTLEAGSGMIALRT